MGFSLENIIDDTAPYTAPDHAFIGTISGMVHSFPWERFERFFESRPLINASAVDQVFLLRVLAIQELLCLDDEGVLKWLKSQMYLLSFLSPGFTPKVPTQKLLNTFRDKLQEANLLEPFRMRCQSVILKQNAGVASSEKTTSYLEAFAPSPLDLSASGMMKQEVVGTVTLAPDDEVEDKWVICPKCESSALYKVESESVSSTPQAGCDQCGHEFNV